MDWPKPKTEEIMVPCKKCGNKSPASAMKLDLDEKLMICPDCIKNKKIHKEIEQEAINKKQAAQMQNSSSTPQIKITRSEEPKSSKMAHKCTSCGYKFKIDPETRIPKNCPYCNSRVMSY